MNTRTELLKYLFCLGVFLFSLSFSANTRATLRDACVSTIDSFFGTPVIDGDIQIQNWIKASKVNLNVDLGAGDGATKSAEMLMGTTGGNLYIALIIESAFIDVGRDNRIVLGFSPYDSVTTHDWKIIITLSDAVMVDETDQTPFSITYWRDSSTWNNAGTSTDTISPVPGAGPSWLNDSNNIRYSKNGSRLSIEMRVPIETNAVNAANVDKVYLPTSSSTFQYYINYLETANLTTAAVVDQNPWPHVENITPGTSNFLIRNMPEPIRGVSARWGTTSLYSRPTDCAGIALSGSNIGVIDPATPGSIIYSPIYYQPSGGFPETTFAQCDALADDYQWPASRSDTNQFVARINNNMADARNVSAKFSIANFGIPAPDDWKEIGHYGSSSILPSPPNSVSNNPTSPPTSIPSGSSADLIAEWILSYKQSCVYSKVGYEVPGYTYVGHQCIHVELSSPQPDTRFENKSAWRNVDFGPASVYSRVARISGNQGPLPAGEKHKYILVTEQDQGRIPADPPGRKSWLRLLYGNDRQLPGVVAKSAAPQGQNESTQPDDDYFSLHSPELTKEAARIFEEGVTDICALIVRGYLQSDSVLNINGTDYNIIQEAGEFGVVGGHTGQITGCGYIFDNDDLKNISDANNIFGLDVSPGEMAQIMTGVEAVEAQYAFNILIGTNSPHSSFSNVVDPGIGIKLGLEYYLKTGLTLEGVLALHSFEDKGLGADLDITQLSINVRQYYTPTYVRPFVSAGLGMYKLDPGDDEFGYNVGAGIQYDITPRLSLEGAYNYHDISVSGLDPQFSTLQIGLRYLF